MPRNSTHDDDQDAFSAAVGGGGDLLGEDDLFGMAVDPTPAPAPALPPPPPPNSEANSSPASKTHASVNEVSTAEGAGADNPTKAARKPRKKKTASDIGEESQAANVAENPSEPAVAPESPDAESPEPPAKTQTPATVETQPAQTPSASSASPVPRTATAPASAPPRAVQAPDGYVVVARRYRPQTFGELVGQEAVRKSLCGAIEQGRVGHAFLFSGPRGTGKTSTARILAKALNCMENGPRPDPCGRCASCLSIASGSSLDVIEIDAASNTGVDNIRDLRSGVVLAPFSRYKVYIIDEVHMLSTGAFNALLKTLEEPPGQVVFVLATTEIHKVPETIISRCQCFQFRRFTEDELTGHLGYILDTELARRGVLVDPDDRRKILDLLARSADGGMRDAQVLLDQILVLATDRLDYETVRRFVGAVDTSRLDHFIGMIYERRTADLLEFIAELVDSGQDLETFTKSLVGECRNLLVLKAAPESDGLVTGSPERLAECVALAARLPVAFLVDLSEQAVALTEAMKTASNPRFLLELFVVRLSRIRPVDDLDRILRRIDQLEGALASAGVSPVSGGGTRTASASEAPRAYRTEEQSPAAPPPTASEPQPLPMPTPPVEARTKPNPATSQSPVNHDTNAGPPPANSAELKSRVLAWAESNATMMVRALENCAFALDGGRLMISVPRNKSFVVELVQRMEARGQLQSLARAIGGANTRGQYQLVDEIPSANELPRQPVARPSSDSVDSPKLAPRTDSSEENCPDAFGDGAHCSMEDEVEAFERQKTQILRGDKALEVIRQNPELSDIYDRIRAELPIDESGIELRVQGNLPDGRAA